MNALARIQTRFLQNGHLHFYLLIMILTTVVLLGASFLLQEMPVKLKWWSDVRSYEAIVVFVILAAIVTAVRTQSRLFAVVALGVIGYSVVLIYIMFGAPDLAMTQFSIDTLTVILLVLVLYRLPRYARYSKTYERVRDGTAAAGIGVMIALLTFAATSTPVQSRISSYFSENSYVLAKGRNIVNVILVDFRALDTMGEITVLAVAAIGVYALLKLRASRDRPD
jgi:multicomponent Na+:H+ antiporter subunit A